MNLKEIYKSCIAKWEGLRRLTEDGDFAAVLVGCGDPCAFCTEFDDDCHDCPVYEECGGERSNLDEYLGIYRKNADKELVLQSIDHILEYLRAGMEAL